MIKEWQNWTTVDLEGHQGKYELLRPWLCNEKANASSSAIGALIPVNVYLPTIRSSYVVSPLLGQVSLVKRRHFRSSRFVANAAAKVASSCPLASPDPPRYDELAPTNVRLPETSSKSALHPRIAVLLGVSTSWHVPLLVARALSTVPAMWWGLRCAFTFLGDLLLSDGMGNPGDRWTVEKRFRVTEVFLAILWVCQLVVIPVSPL